MLVFICYEDMEVYLIVFWYFRKEIDLLFLVYEFVDVVWDLFYVWCVLGNVWFFVCDYE